MAVFSVPQLVKQDVSKSRFNLSCARRSPIDIGLAIPIYHKLILPGDDFRIKDVSAKIKSLPFVNSLMGSFRLQLDWFFEPFTNLYGFMDNNEALNTRDIIQMNLWTLSTASSLMCDAQTANNEGYDFSSYWFNELSSSPQANGSNTVGFVSDCSLFNYLGFPARWNAFNSRVSAPSDITNPYYSGTLRFDATAWLGYWDIYRTFYTNKQVKYGAVYSSWNDPYGSSFDKMNDRAYDYFSTYAYQIKQSEFDAFFKALRCSSPSGLDDTSGTNYSANTDIGRFMAHMKPFIKGYLYNMNGSNPTYEDPIPGLYANPFCGLGLVQYRPDLFRSIILPTEPTMVASASVSTIDALRIASHLQRLYDLYDASGGQFSKWYEMQFDVDISGNVDRPLLLGTSHQYIVVDDVTATALTGSASNPDVAVGEQFGKINQNTGFTGVRFRSKYHGYLYAIVTLVPEVDYSNTLNPLMFNTKFGDIYTPAMAQLGYEGMPLGLYCACAPNVNPYNSTYIDNTDETLRGPSVAGNSFFTSSQFSIKTSIGRNVHWYSYMTDYNLNFGAFSEGGTLQSWTLSRSFMRSRFVPDSDENPTTYDFDLNMYVIPTDWDYFFAYQQADNQSWYLQLGFDIEATRPIPKYMLGKIV